MEQNEDKLITVLNNGYVRLVDVMGSDLSVVNAARASFAKESKEMTVNDGRLLDFLVRENHMSPFRHAFMTFEFLITSIMSISLKIAEKTLPVVNAEIMSENANTSLETPRTIARAVTIT